MTEYTHCWEQWVGSTGRNVIVEMPDNAPTKPRFPLIGCDLCC